MAIGVLLQFMQILLIKASGLPETIFGKTIPIDGISVQHSTELSDLTASEWDLLIDFDFELHHSRISAYKQLQKPVLVGSVLFTLKELEVTVEPIARFNHWPGFENRNLLEIAVNENQRDFFEKLVGRLQTSIETTADIPGFVTARVVSVIINEAFLALQENVSGRSEIDTAMKLGTNYPYGPFEWCNIIGPATVYRLLEKLSVTASRYQPASLLKQS